MLDKILNMTLMLLVTRAVTLPLEHFGILQGHLMELLLFWVAVGISFIVHDLADFHRTPKPWSILRGALIAPVWLLIRRQVK